MHFGNGDFYEGEFASDKREGKGRFYVKGEDLVLEGVFRGGDLVKGKMVDKAGNVWIGEWKAGKMEGKGRVEWANGNVYEGGFRQGKRCGRGKMVYQNIRNVSGNGEKSSGKGKKKNEKILE